MRISTKCSRYATTPCGTEMAEEPENRRRRRRPRRRAGSKAGAQKGGPRDAEADAREKDARSETSSRAADGGAKAGRGHGTRGGRSDRTRRGRNKTRTGGRAARGRPRRVRQAESWWARRWVEVLESFQVGRRLGRGRSYARQGQVVEIELGKGFVTALVQGSRDAPYLVRMRLSMLSSIDWKKVTRSIAEDPELTGALVAGRIPENIEEVFQPLGLSLFPTASGDLKTACSCPDQANPCKHVAAVYYLLGEEFDRDPFLVFRLRGIDRAELVEAIGGSAALRGAPVAAPERPEPQVAPQTEAGTAEAGEATPAPEPPEPVEREPEPLPTEAHAFWAGESSAANGGEVRIPPMAAVRRNHLVGGRFRPFGQSAATPIPAPPGIRRGPRSTRSCRCARSRRRHRRSRGRS